MVWSDHLQTINYLIARPSSVGPNCLVVGVSLYLVLKHFTYSNYSVVSAVRNICIWSYVTLFVLHTPNVCTLLDSRRRTEDCLLLLTNCGRHCNLRSKSPKRFSPFQTAYYNVCRPLDRTRLCISELQVR